MDYFAHETAVIEEGSQIGSGTKIWHFAHVMPEARIGRDCNFGQNVFIGKRVVIGDHVKVQNNVSLYEGVNCESEVFIGPSAVFTNIKNPRSNVNRQDQYELTLVRYGATIGANATIVCGVTIGLFAFIGAGAVLTHDVPAYALMLGNPARHIGWMSEYGHRLHFKSDNKATCPESGNEYILKEHRVERIN